MKTGGVVERMRIVELDLGQAYDWIVAEVARKRPVAESMAALIDRCGAALPHPDWAKLRRLPYGDLSSMVRWLERAFREEPPEVPLKGLWFGLFNPCPDGRTPVADMYVSRSQRFDASADDVSWAVGAEWWPDVQYANSTVLAAIYRTAYPQAASPLERDECLANDAEYTLVLGYAAFAVREVLGQVEPSLVLGRSEELGIAVGWDSGDAVVLGRLRTDGLVPIG